MNKRKMNFQKNEGLLINGCGVLQQVVEDRITLF